MRKTFSFNLEQDNISRLDQFVISPCSRSDLIDSLINYALQTPYVLESFVQSKLDEMKIKVESIDTSIEH